MKTVLRELVALSAAAIAGIVIVELGDRLLERRAERRRDDHPSRGRYE